MSGELYQSDRIVYEKQANKSREPSTPITEGLMNEPKIIESTQESERAQKAAYALITYSKEPLNKLLMLDI